MIRRSSLRGVATLVLAVVLLLVAGPASAFTGPATSANARFVVATYQQMLGHDPDDAGLDTNLDLIAAGGDRSRLLMVESLLYSPEASGREVNWAYYDILGRGAEPDGQTFWTAHLQGNDVLDLRVLLFSSDEYYRKMGGTDEAWVRSLYENVLGRAAEPVGLQYWVGEARAGTARPLIVAGFYLGVESLGGRSDSYYRLVFNRPPTTSERGEAINLIAAHGERGLYARLWASDENYERFFDAAWGPQ